MKRITTIALTTLLLAPLAALHAANKPQRIRKATTKP
jgi:hypothetical protein